MNRQIRTALIVLLSLVFLGSLLMLLRQWLIYRKGDELYRLAQQLAEVPATQTQPAQTQPAQSQPKPGEVPAAPAASAPAPAEPGQPEAAPPTDPVPPPLAEIQLDALRAVSGAVVGWISIPDTPLSYPLVQGEDNEYYLDHGWNGRQTVLGSIFMDSRNDPELTDHHTLIYGHRMKNGTMFASLSRYNKLDHLIRHPFVYIKTAQGLYCYEIFAAYEAPVRSCTYRLDFPDDAARQELIDFALEQSVIDTGIVPAPTDRILTLSTCTGHGYDTRWVVQAVLTRDTA